MAHHLHYQISVTPGNYCTFYAEEKTIMSTSNSSYNSRDRIKDYAERESLSPRDQLLGQLVVILLFLLAVLLRSLWL